MAVEAKELAAPMGTFIGHIVPGLALTLLGLWHTSNTIKAYKHQGPSNFKSKTWYPFNIPLFSFKHLELLIIFSFSIFAIVMQILDYPLLHFSFKPNNFEHAAMFLHLAIYAGFTLAVELTRSQDMFSGLVGILAATVFSQELFIFHFHSADHVGLEGHYHWLLQVIVFVSLSSALAVACIPSSFPAALVLSTSVLFQGCWFMDMGFMLWVPRLVPKGCHMRLIEGDDMGGAVACSSEYASMRARALANLQFSCILAGISIFTAFLCLKSDGKSTDNGVSKEYERLGSRGSSVGQITIDMDGSKLVHP